MAISTLTLLAERGNELEVRFKAGAADTRSDEFLRVVADLHDWLRQCVDQGRFLPPGSPDRRGLQGQIDYWTSRLQSVGHAIDDIDRLAPFDPSAGHVLADDLFPYHGLLAATGDSRKVFAGRDEQIKEYADHIDAHAALLIQSESGGGKSSVAMAGVLPELQLRHADWLVVHRVTPGTQPADTLRAALRALLRLDTVDAPSVRAALAGRTVLVYVDQLEELLTMCSDVAQQSAFSELLAELAGPEDAPGPGPFRLLATMRVDHYERLANSDSCRPLYQLLTRENSVKTLPPMSLAQIRSVILKPAEAIGLRFVPASIVERLASETANAPSGLPLLQFALQRLWDERPRLGDQADGPRLDMITEKSFAELPTVSSALGTVAEKYYAAMDAQGLVEACRRLMLELTVIDERLEVPLRRRRAEPEVLRTLVGAGYASADKAEALIDGLVERRLLVRTGEGESRQIEVAHEALFRYWERFQGWIYDEDTRTTLRETRQITRDALLWDRARRSPDLLNLRGDPLKRALAHRRALWLEPQATEYVDACEQAARAAEEREAQTAKALADLEAQRVQALVEAEKRKFEAAQAQADAETARKRAALEVEQRRLEAAKALAEAEAERRRAELEAEEHRLQASIALAEAETKQRRAESEARRDRRLRNWLFAGGAAITLVGAAAIVTLEQSRSAAETARSANTISAAYVLPQVRPMEALDLALTMKATLKTPESLATLAHAIDDTGQAVKVGDRKDGTAFFPPSGLATVQLVGGESGLSHALVRPLGAALDDLQPAVRVALGLKPGEDLASVDVGPAAADGKRLVVASYVGPVGAQGRSLSRLQVFEIAAGSAQGRPLKEIPFPSNVRPTRTASFVAFDGSGRRLAVVALLRVPVGLKGEEYASQVIDWTVGGEPVIDERAVGEPNAATALAFLGGKGGAGGQLIKGRADGRIDCGPDGLTEGADWPRVVQLKTSGASRYAALHEDNSISVGDCASGWARRVLDVGLVKPEQLALRPHVGSDGVELTYSLRGRLVCQRLVGPAREEDPCAGHGLFADAAVPAVDAQGQLLGYRVLDSEAPLMSFWRLDVSPPGEDAGPPLGLPVAKEEPSETAWPTVAGSPNRQHRMVIEVADGKNFQARRLAADGRAGKPLDIASPQWTAVNDRGLAVVLASRKAERRHLLTAIGPDDRVLGSVNTFPDAACMKLSPDGSQLLVASDRWSALRLTLDDKGLPRNDKGLPLGDEDLAKLKFGKAGNAVGDQVTACAVGNGPAGKVVLASELGNVRHFDAKAGWVSVSDLVPFALGTAALDVSIDAGNRFVAVLSSRRAARCRNGSDGHLLRIWDLEQRPRPEYPVASACIERELRAIGPVAKVDGQWQLPLYHRNGDSSDKRPLKLRQTLFVCRACSDRPKDAATSAAITAAAEQLGAEPMAPALIERKYGLRLGN